MANVRSDHSLESAQEPKVPKASRLPTRSKREQASVSSRVKWIVAGIMLGAAAGWMVFRAFLDLITLD